MIRVASSTRRALVNIRSPSTVYRLRDIGKGKNPVLIRNCATKAGHAVEDEAARLRPVAIWLIGVGATVAVMVAVGGVTRITRSGLSMTSWNLQGTMPPRNDAEWEEEFARYKTFPEWHQRQSMTVEEFKFIYFWEYGHRMLGRFIGVAFALPAAYFIATGRITRRLYPRMALLFGLGGAQGLIGWWMVKSGLEVDPKQKKEIRVSPYRLATHLGMAFATLTAIFWTVGDLLNPAEKARQIASQINPEVLAKFRNLRRVAIVNVGLVATTAIAGAFVAGNDAGRAFNTFPLMGDKFIPDEILRMQPTWRNFFENTATVQFDHRMLAYTTLASVTGAFLYAKRGMGGKMWRVIPTNTRKFVTATTHSAWLQAVLGISALLFYVPNELAIAHQTVATILMGAAPLFAQSLRFSVVSSGSVTPGLAASAVAASGVAMGAAATAMRVAAHAQRVAASATAEAAAAATAAAAKAPKSSSGAGPHPSAEEAVKAALRTASEAAQRAAKETTKAADKVVKTGDKLAEIARKEISKNKDN